MTQIPLTRTKGKRVPHDDALVSVTLVFAPFDAVLPATVGTFRATYGHAMLEDADDRKDIVMRRLQDAETQPNVLHFQSGTILEPSDAPHISVIEDWCGPDPDALGHVLPETTLISFFTVWEKATVEQHSYTVRRGPEVIRHVSLDRNMTKRGWTWTETGDPHPWEDPDRLTARALSKRCDRALIFEYARALGCDLQAILGARRVTRARLVRAISDWDTTPDLEPTGMGEDARRAATRAGFGGTDTHEDFEDQKRIAGEAQQAFADQTDRTARINRARSPKALAQILTDAAFCPDDDWAGHIRVMTWRSALTRAYHAFPDAPGLPELEARAIRETAGDDFPVTKAELARMAANALESTEQAALVRAYRKVIATARDPLELAEGSLLFMGARGARFAPQFRINALFEFLEAAIKLDPHDHGTEAIALNHDEAQRDAGQIAPGQPGDGAIRLDRARRKDS